MIHSSLLFHFAKLLDSLRGDSGNLAQSRVILAKGDSPVLIEVEFVEQNFDFILVEVGFDDFDQRGELEYRQSVFLVLVLLHVEFMDVYVGLLYAFVDSGEQ